MKEKENQIDRSDSEVNVDRLVSLRQLYLEYDGNKWLWQQACESVGKYNGILRHKYCNELQTKYEKELKYYQEERDRHLDATIESFIKFVKASS